MKRHFDLRPISFRRRRALFGRAVIWGMVCCGVAAALAAGSLSARHEAGRVRDALAAADRRGAPLDEIREQVAALRATLARMTADRDRYRQLLQDRPPARLMGIVSRCAEQTPGQVRLDRLLLVTEGKAAPQRSVELEGEAQDYAAAAQFATRLRGTRAFSSVELKSTAEHDGAQLFHLRCTY